MFISTVKMNVHHIAPKTSQNIFQGHNATVLWVQVELTCMLYILCEIFLKLIINQEIITDRNWSSD